MGISQSRAEVYADTLIDVGFSAVFEAMAKTSFHTDMTQIFKFYGCKVEHIHHINFIQKNSVSISQLSQISTNTNIDQAIEANIKAAASALAEGFGISDAETRIVVPTTLIAKSAVKSSISSIVDQSLSMIQGVDCYQSELKDIAYCNFEQIAQNTVNNVMKSDNVVQAKQDIIAQLEIEGVAEAKGIDAWAIAVIAVAIAVISVVVYGAVVGKLLMSPGFWLIIATVVTALFGYIFVSSWTGTWPGKKIKDKVCKTGRFCNTDYKCVPQDKPDSDPNPPSCIDTELDKKNKGDKNRTVRKVGGIGAGIGIVVMLVLGFLSFRQKTR